MNYTVLIKNKDAFTIPNNVNLNIVTNQGVQVVEPCGDNVEVPVHRFETNLMNFRLALDEYNRANRDCGVNFILTFVTEGVGIYNLIKC